MWVPGCSTGEEAYSLAIVLMEYLGGKTPGMQVQIFATDVSDVIINKARVGLYPESIAGDMSPERVRRFFQRVDGGFQISKSIRDMCVFAKQDLAKDPPFSKIDLISCRNVMIYMAEVLQKRIIPTFHYALNQGGFLFLGSSETVGTFGNLFALADKKHKLYSKKMSPAAVSVDFIPYYDDHEETKLRPEAPARVDLQKVADQILLSRYVPASVLVNNHLEIVQFTGQTGRFLDPAPGDASLNLLKMVKSGLHAELRRAFQNAKRNVVVRKENVLVDRNGDLKAVNFEIVPVKNIPGSEHYYMVVFEEANTLSPNGESRNSTKKEIGRKESKATSSQVELENKRLSEELEATREYLQSIIEEQKTTNEELRSANEEIQSSNEELQSINEEMETAKEELQSTNEELMTVNDEMHTRNDELTQLNNDLNNLLSSVNIPIIMLGNDLRIRRFTPMAEKIMNLIPADIGRPIMDIRPNLARR